MRTVLLANNRLGARIGRYLADRGDLAGLVVHPPDRRQADDDLLALGVPVWTWPDGRDQVAATEPACILSVLFGYVVPAEWLSLASWRALNVHPALLPWNRGSAPNVWPLVDGSPAGTTLHVMDERLDTGPIVAQREVAVRPDDTARSLYDRLIDASAAMFEDVWPGITGIEPVPQPGGGSYHRLRDLETLDLVPEDLAVLDRLRARTFPPHGAEFERDGRRWRATVHIEPIF